MNTRAVTYLLMAFPRLDLAPCTSGGRAPLFLRERLSSPSDLGTRAYPWPLCSRVRRSRSYRRSSAVPVEADIIRSMLMYFLLPLWLCAGFADWLCHRASHIATTSGPKESLIHLAMLAEMGVAVTLAMTFQINALIILLMLICWAMHEATAVWDVFFAIEHRVITPIEQWVHSYLGVLPLLSLVLVVALSW